MLKAKRFLYGTVEECVEEIWKRIDFENMEFPEFDFCNDPYDDNITEDDLNNAEDGTDLGDGWSGCKVNNDFDSKYASFNLIFGYYGGGCFEALCICDGDENDDRVKREMVSKICDVGDLEPDWNIVCEFVG